MRGSLTEAVREALPVAAPAGRCSVRSTAATRCCSTNWSGAPTSTGCRSAVERLSADGAAAGSWSTTRARDWHADARAAGRPGAPVGRRSSDGVAPRAAAAARRIAVASTAVLALALPGGTPLPDAVRCAGGQPQNACTPRRSRCRPASGARAATSSWCGCRSVGSATTSPAASATTTCCRGRQTTWPTVFGVTVDPVDCRVHRWLDAMPQYGPGHGELVAELRAGLPPSLAVAGALPRRHRGARLRGGDRRRGRRRRWSQPRVAR